MGLIICHYLKKKIYESLQFSATARVSWLFVQSAKIDISAPPSSSDYSSEFFRSDLLYDITSLIVMRTRGCYCSHVVFYVALVGAKVVFSRVGHFCANSSAQLSRWKKVHCPPTFWDNASLFSTLKVL